MNVVIYFHIKNNNLQVILVKLNLAIMEKYHNKIN